MHPPAVVVAEDSLVIRAVLVEQLLSRGYRVIEAGDGEQALAACRRERLDVVLLDVEMPQLDGHAVPAGIKADPRLADIPVVFVTARVTTDDVVEGLRLGAHDYLRKPFEPSELLARVHAAVRSKALQDELRLRNAELELASRTDALTGLSNRRHLEEQLQRLAAEGDRLSVLLCDMTGSSRSTTPEATPPATRSCGWWPGGCGPPPGRATRPGAGAARSSWSCCPAPAAPRRPPWASGPGWRSRPRRSRWPTSCWP